MFERRGGVMKRGGDQTAYKGIRERKMVGINGLVEGEKWY
jgi:hypothetical protein